MLAWPFVAVKLSAVVIVVPERSDFGVGVVAVVGFGLMFVVVIVVVFGCLPRLGRLVAEGGRLAVAPGSGPPARQQRRCWWQQQHLGLHRDSRHPGSGWTYDFCDEEACARV